MMEDKQHAHQLLDRIPPDQMTAAVRFLEFLLLDSISRSLRTAELEDEEISEEEQQAVERSREWLRHNKLIRHEDVLSEFGLSMEDFDKMGRTPLPLPKTGSNQ